MVANNLKYFFILFLSMSFGSQFVYATDSTSKVSTSNTIGVKKIKKSRKPSSVDDSGQVQIQSLHTNLLAVMARRHNIEEKMVLLRKGIASHFDSSVANFILDTHIEAAKLCSSYQSYSNGCLLNDPSQAGSRPADCDSKEAPPELLKRRWTDLEDGKGAYCLGSNRSTAGGVSASICDDETLRAKDAGHVFSSVDCQHHLKDYRQNRIDLSNVEDEENDLKDEIYDLRHP